MSKIVKKKIINLFALYRFGLTGMKKFSWGLRIVGVGTTEFTIGLRIPGLWTTGPRTCLNFLGYLSPLKHKK